MFDNIPDENLDVSPKVRDTLDDVKRIKVNPPKNGCLYPALSDIEASSNANSDREQYFSTEETPTKKNVRFEHNVQPYSSQDEDEDDR